MRGHRAVVVALVCLVAACAPPPPTPSLPEAEVPAGFPDGYYRQAVARGEPVFRVDPSQSQVVVEVRRGGSLARLGHDHVVASRDVRGFVAPDAGRADLYLPLDRLVVDDPRMRAEAGFETRPSDADIAGTRANMLSVVLEAERHPLARISVSAPPRAAGAGEVHERELERTVREWEVTLALHGVTRTLQVPVTVLRRDDRVEARGHFTIEQSAFGITPYSVLGGALRVEDRLDVRFDIRARRIAP